MHVTIHHFQEVQLEEAPPTAPPTAPPQSRRTKEVKLCIIYLRSGRAEDQSDGLKDGWKEGGAEASKRKVTETQTESPIDVLPTPENLNRHPSPQLCQEIPAVPPLCRRWTCFLSPRGSDSSPSSSSSSSVLVSSPGCFTHQLLVLSFLLLLVFCPRLLAQMLHSSAPRPLLPPPPRLLSSSPRPDASLISSSSSPSSSCSSSVLVSSRRTNLDEFDTHQTSRAPTITRYTAPPGPERKTCSTLPVSYRSTSSSSSLLEQKSLLLLFTLAVPLPVSSGDAEQKQLRVTTQHHREESLLWRVSRPKLHEAEAPETHQRLTRDSPETHQRLTRDSPETHQRLTRDSPETHQRLTRDSPETHQRLRDRSWKPEAGNFELDGRAASSQALRTCPLQARGHVLFRPEDMSSSGPRTCPLQARGHVLFRPEDTSSSGLRTCPLQP
ncbi:unnamed protein product [Pleuronectes platessa]|uniref:Uncharacterized protein n=1 Tax=Pleuronectes platessa TaxID=8262 RepID=A0A9N7YTU1_PLEPL|nr:unnamed protein product [Pleuronectes platessa]